MEYTILILLLPLLSFLVLGLGGKWMSHRTAGLIGTAVLGGTVASTVLGIFMVPVFFLLIRSWFKSRSRQEDAAQPAPIHPESAA